MAAYKYNGKSFRFLVNGQTGEVQGERPWSIWKILLAVLLALIVAAAIAYVADPEAFRAVFTGQAGTSMQIDWGN
jgi:hypothetical protein